MDGLLSDRPLAELIREIMSARLSGALRLARERARAAVYFEDGVVVAAPSNLRPYKLAEILRRSGSVAPAFSGDHAAAKVSDEGVAADLVAAGALTADELGEALTAQAIGVLRATLGWGEGEWEFDPRVRLATPYRARPDVARLLAEYARGADPSITERAFGEAETVSPSPGSADAETLGTLFLNPVEAYVLSRLSAPVPFGDLALSCGLPEAEVRRSAYVLLLCGLIERAGAPPVFTPEFLGRAAARRPAKDSEAPGEYGPAALPEGRDEKGGPARADAGPGDELRTAKEELLERARMTTHYEVLGVARTAGADELKRAYHALARRLHPDRLRRDSDASLAQQLDASFARVTKAYDVLKDPGLRASYDLKLAAQDAAGVTGGQRPAAGVSAAGEGRPGEDRVVGTAGQQGRAEERFQDGLAAMEKGDAELARRLLGEAALLAPRQARYRAHYGRALAHDRASRRQAETELLAAISLDERNPSYRVMLAELYCEVGLRRKAESELRRALAIEPGHGDARRLLERLGS